MILQEQIANYLSACVAGYFLWPALDRSRLARLSGVEISDSSKPGADTAFWGLIVLDTRR